MRSVGGVGTPLGSAGNPPSPSSSILVGGGRRKSGSSVAAGSSSGPRKEELSLLPHIRAVTGANTSPLKYGVPTDSSQDRSPTGHPTEGTSTTPTKMHPPTSLRHPRAGV